MTRLEVAYSRAAALIGAEKAECLEVVEEVERIRSSRRPERVRVVLLAESHVWTSFDEGRSRVTQPDGVETGFARFVYCLGCGEPQLVQPTVMPNNGTPQFWKIFHDAIYGPDVPHAGLLRTGQLDSQKRVHNKAQLLATLQSAGVWLVDASVTALVGNGIKLTQPHYREILKTCWESHISDVLRSCSPSGVLIIGVGVDRAIGTRVRQDLGSDVEVARINQPNARAFGSIDRSNCFDFCRRHLIER